MNSTKIKKHIETNNSTKIKFDKFKSDLTFKLKRKITSDSGITALLSTFKDYRIINNLLKKQNEKVKTLESELEKRELEIEELRK